MSKTVGVGMGIDIKDLVAKLKIPEARAIEMVKVARQLLDEPDEIEALKKGITTCRKANELALLSFLIGIKVGSVATMQMTNEKVPDMLKAALLSGATHPEDVKKAAIEGGVPAELIAKMESKTFNGEDDPDAQDDPDALEIDLDQTDKPAKVKKEKEEDRMYG